MTEIDKKIEIAKKIIELLKDYDDVELHKFDDGGVIDFPGVSISFEFDKVTDTEVSL